MNLCVELLVNRNLSAYLYYDFTTIKVKPDVFLYKTTLTVTCLSSYIVKYYGKDKIKEIYNSWVLYYKENNLNGWFTVW